MPRGSLTKKGTTQAALTEHLFFVKNGHCILRPFLNWVCGNQNFYSTAKARAIGHGMDSLSLPKLLQSTLDAGEEFVDFCVGDDERRCHGDEVAYASHDGAFLADVRGGGDAE